jgi:hypothetical protein
LTSCWPCRRQGNTQCAGRARTLLVAHTPRKAIPSHSHSHRHINLSVCTGREKPSTHQASVNEEKNILPCTAPRSPVRGCACTRACVGRAEPARPGSKIFYSFVESIRPVSSSERKNKTLRGGQVWSRLPCHYNTTAPGLR